MIDYLLKYINKGLFQVIYHPTFRCNSKCITCFNWKNLEEKRKDELTLDELKKITKNIPDFPWLMLSGGEPFLREDIDSIINIFVSNNNVKHVTIPTNGIFSKTIMDKISLILKNNKKISLNLVLSLDGLEEVYEQIRGVKGGFKKVIRTFNLCKDLKKEYSNFSIKFNTVLTNYNYKYFDEIVKFVMKLKPDMHSFDFVRGDPRDQTVKLPPRNAIKKLVEKIKKVYVFYGGFKNLNMHSKILSGLSARITNKYLDLFTDIIKYNKQLIPCYAGKSTIVLYPYGDVAFCEMLNTIGNLRACNYDLKKLLHSKKATSMRAYIKNKECYCYHPCYQDINILFNPIYLFEKKTS